METPAPVEPRTLLPRIAAGAPPAEADRAALALAAQAETPEGALEVMRALLEWFGRPDAAGKCAEEPPESRKGEALSLLAWALADQRHDDAAERTGKAAIELGHRRAATDALLLVYGRRGREADRDALASKYLASEDEEGYHALVPVQKAALEAWEAGDLVRSTNLSRALVERSPADMGALFRAGYGLYVGGQWAAALELLERYRKWTENDEDARLPIAGCLYGLGRYDGAMAILGEIVEDPEECVDHTFLAWVQIAWNELGKGLLDRAEGALGRARGVLEAAGAVDEEVLGPGMADLDAIEGVIDALSGQLDLAHRSLTKMRRVGSPSASVLEEAIADVESGRVRAFGVELPRHRRGRPRGALAERLREVKPGAVLDLENGTWDAGGVELPAGVTVRGQGPDTILSASTGPVVVSRGDGGRLEKLSVILGGTTGGEDQPALLVEGGDLCALDCVLEAKRGVAAAIRQDARPTFEGVSFRGGLGMGVYDSGAPVVRGGTIGGGAKRFGVLVGGQATGEWLQVEIAQTDWACVRVMGTASPTFAGCKVHGSKGGSGFWIGEDAKGVFAGNEVWENKYPGFVVDDRSKPVIRGNRVHHHACAAIQLAGQSGATVEQNEVFDTEAAHVECLHESTAIVRGNHLRGGAGPGVWVLHVALPTVEDNQIEGTKRPGVEVAYSAKPLVRRNRIERTQAAGIRITENASGTYESNTIVECLSGIDVGGSATPTLRAARVERPSFAGLVLQGGAAVKADGVTTVGGKVGLDLGGRASLEVCRLRVEGAEACPVQANGAVRAVLVGATLEPARQTGPTVAIAGGADITLRDATVRAGPDGAAILVRGQGVVRVEGGTVQGGGRTPIIATELGRVRVRVASITGTGGVGIDASGGAGVALEDAHVEGEAVRLSGQASREVWEEPPAPDAHAAVLLLVRAPVDEAVVAAALGEDAGAEGLVRFAVGRTPAPRAALQPVVAEDAALAAAVREAGAWVSIHRKPGVEAGQEVAAMRTFAHAVLRAVRATGALAVFVPRGARLVAAAGWDEARIDGPELGRLFCAVRATPVGANVVVETVGLAAFGQQDVQCESVLAHRAILEPIFGSFVDAIVAEPYRYVYRAVTRPVAGSPQTFMVQEGKHDFPPARKVWSLQPIGDLGAGGGWAKQAKPAWGKAASKGFGAG
jgi:tetratricopeptide (TPR) repeat protein